tara:strand:- start:190 stop:525 length:336 start_codon:yes stop_codon:yes gene_type:complete
MKMIILDGTESISIEKEVADEFVKKLKSLVGNKFIGLRYYSKNEGKFKKYNISFGVKKHIKGTGRKDDPEFSFTAYDHNKKGYRTFNLAKFSYINFRGRFYTFGDIYDLSA